MEGVLSFAVGSHEAMTQHQEEPENEKAVSEVDRHHGLQGSVRNDRYNQ